MARTAWASPPTGQPGRDRGFQAKMSKCAHPTAGANLCRNKAAVTEPAAVAERYFGTPYLWGGRDSLGIDCSGLVQQALYACGRACPRDADQQMQAFPAEIGPDAVQRGDLIFWDGHVGIMLDEARLLHANSHHMAVAIERLSTVIDRNLAAGNGEPLGARRP